MSGVLLGDLRYLAMAAALLGPALAAVAVDWALRRRRRRTDVG